jgi:Cu/Ag efflux pump CusA
MNRILDRVSRELRSVPGVHNVGAHVGRAILSDQVVGINASELWVNLDPRADYDATVAAVQEVVGGYPGVDIDVLTFLRSRFGEALSGVDEPIVVRLYGQELDVLRRQADKVEQSLAGIRGLVDPHVELESEEPVVEIKVDLDAAEVHGVKPGDVRRAAATLLAGIVVGNLFEEQKIFEVVVWGVPRLRHSVAEIGELLIDTPAGGSVRLADLASVRIAAAPDVIRRENVARRLDVVANVNGRAVDEVAAEVRGRLRDTQFPLEYHAELLGDFAAQESARARVLAVGLAAVIGILFLLQAAFGSWRLAIAVLLTLPIALAGGVIATVASGTALSIGSLAGFLTVFGLAVRQGILLIHGCRDLRHRDGHDFGPELARRGTRQRATPILMAAIVTAVAVLPFAVFGTRPGHEILGPMAIVILGGLVTATLYSLCVVPVLYARFGAGAMPDAIDDEDLGIAV